MLDRCYNSTSGGYQNYGERGIKVCSDWLDFSKFLNFWGFPPFEDASIGRIDNNGNYEPANCEWQTQEQQNDNTRRNKFITWNGKTQTIKDWAKEYNIGSRRLSERLRRGWTIEKSLTTACPKGYQAERDERIENNKKNWAAKGQIYRKRSKDKKKNRAMTLDTSQW